MQVSNRRGLLSTTKEKFNVMWPAGVWQQALHSSADNTSSHGFLTIHLVSGFKLQ
jgi:hypothetical protein